MELSEGRKQQLLASAIEIAKAAAGSGGAGCISDSNLANIIKTTYEQLVEITKTF